MFNLIILIILFWTRIVSTPGIHNHFDEFPDEVFEIEIDSKIERIDTTFYPKYKYGSDYRLMCISRIRYMNDTIIMNNQKFYNKDTLNRRVCRDGVEMGDAFVKIQYERYKATDVYYKIRYEYYQW